MDTDPMDDAIFGADPPATARRAGAALGDRAFDATASALAACLFSAPSIDHLWWTVLVTDPALRDTPSHLRLVGHYVSEIEALDAADRLSYELNCCLLPGEARLTVTPIGIEPTAAVMPSTQFSPIQHGRISPV